MKKHLRKKTASEKLLSYNLKSLFTLLMSIHQKTLGMEKNGCPTMSLEPKINKSKNYESNNISSSID